jgi:hypothetical protein
MNCAQNLPQGPEPGQGHRGDQEADGGAESLGAAKAIAEIKKMMVERRV